MVGVHQVRMGVIWIKGRELGNDLWFLLLKKNLIVGFIYGEEVIVNYFFFIIFKSRWKWVIMAARTPTAEVTLFYLFPSFHFFSSYLDSYRENSKPSYYNARE